MQTVNHKTLVIFLQILETLQHGFMFPFYSFMLT